MVWSNRSFFGELGGVDMSNSADRKIDFFKDLDNEISKSQLEETQAQLENVTHLLCSLLSRIEYRWFELGKLKDDILADPILNAWWEENKERIKVQKQQERIRMRIRTGALMKLTELEKEALGL